jgi:hypothetical protein
MKTIKLPLYDGTNPSPVKMRPGVNRYTLYVDPTMENPLGQIPKGSNPRYLDSSSKISKSIKASYLIDPNFAIKCGGIHAIIDDGSLSYSEENGKSYVSFTCSESGITGHYDGQHAISQIDQAVRERDESSYMRQHVMVYLTERSAFGSIEEIRNVAQAVNNRSKQQKTSELNVVGGFDGLKGSITYCSTKDIWWAQNQRNTMGEELQSKKETYSWVLISMLSGFLPLTFGPKGTSLGDISGYAKMGEGVVKKFQDVTLAPYFQATFEHVDTVLALADFIRESTVTILGSDVENYAIVKNSVGKKQSEKRVQERQPFKTHLFGRNNLQIEYGLHKDLMPLLVHSLLSACYEYDSSTRKFTTHYTLSEMKAIWLTSGKEVLGAVQSRYNSSWETEYKRRWSDLALDNILWSQTGRLVERSVRNPNSWKQHLQSPQLVA